LRSDNIADTFAEKILYELIEPVDFRCREVANFVEDVAGMVKCFAVPIYGLLPYITCSFYKLE
jgi:hypothetical protein